MNTITITSGVPVPLADGLTSAADLYLPEGDGRHPVLLARTPYSRALTNLHLFNPVRAARRGYVVVVQDCRGRFDGEGSFVPFETESADGAAAIDWCSRQPWSDGTVAMWGASYLGATQLLAAAGGPSALRAVSPSFTAANYRTGWLHEGSVIQQHFLQTWAVSLGTTMPGVSRDARRSLGRFLSDPEGFARPLTDAFDDTAAAAVPHYRRWLERRDDLPYWEALDIDRKYGDLAVAGLHVGGWYDVFVEGTIANFIGLSQQAPSPEARRNQRLIVGPWEHTVIESVVGEVDFGALASPLVVDLAGRQLTFFDEVLAGHEPGLPRVEVFVMGANEWRAFPDWPPASTAATWHLGGRSPQSVRGDGVLTPTPSECGRRWTLLFDPQRPVPSVGGRLVAPGSRIAGPRDQAEVESRDDVLVFTSAPLTEPLTVAGPVSASVGTESDVAAYHVAVMLADVDEAGRSINVVDGAARVRGRQFSETTVELGSTAYRFDRGHRLRVRVAASNHPRLELSGDSASIISVDASLSHLVLPVIEENAS